ncbi:hypothetical protein OG978_01985 [Streptomyces sp. NBC_01591]|uniref:hypothetical protein n=1 Tax=Streptomyces sp. NBC_01591 TaxID=2975888 RepID=UPI002DDAB246|nr:hypothetical protein [Streptomyces sp. NBC_01591]WSD73592.1 hypothetical protein OG978_01985 [Streptomyces sp. NBC_01591]
MQIHRRVKSVDDPGRRTGGVSQVVGRRTDVPAGQSEHELRLGEGATPAHPDDLTVPEERRGNGVRIEDDLEWSSPRTVTRAWAEAWIARFAG